MNNSIDTIEKLQSLAYEYGFGRWTIQHKPDGKSHSTAVRILLTKERDAQLRRMGLPLSGEYGWAEGSSVEGAIMKLEARLKSTFDGQ